MHLPLRMSIHALSTPAFGLRLKPAHQCHDTVCTCITWISQCTCLHYCRKGLQHKHMHQPIMRLEQQASAIICLRLECH